MTTNLPTNYQWLASEPGPKMLVEALKLYGTEELSGDADNPVIMAWAKEIGVANVYSADSVPWCGLFMGVVAKRAGKELPSSPLWALSWSRFGAPTDKPKLGDVLTFKRDGGGHVGLYVGEDSAAYHVLGGNQHDQVSITRIAKSRLYCARSPAYNSRPANVRQVVLAGTGALSHNEA